tara:strand:+ start:69 stop:629 length:561 start_codon:yes stop_codon:yes gene_type:complete
MTKKPKNPLEYCLTAYNGMKSNLYRWGKPETDIRSMTRIFYVNVHDSGKDNIMLISKKAMEFKVKGIQRKTTDDHYTRPQAQAYMIYDYPEKYLSDFEVFKKIFFDARRTITVAKKENDLFRDDTSNDGYNFTIGNRSDKLYELHGIKLFSFSNENYWKDRTFTPVSNDAMIFNNEALLNEERFIV